MCIFIHGMSLAINDLLHLFHKPKEWTDCNKSTPAFNVFPSSVQLLVYTHLQAYTISLTEVMLVKFM